MQYIEIKESIVEQIESGVLQAGQKLPSERQLAESFNTTRVTLREALSILETNGLIYREDRRGWFIAFPRIQIPVNCFSEIDGFVSSDFNYQRELLSAGTLMASKTVNAVMDLPPFSKIHSVEVVHKLNDRPVAVTSYWIKEALCSDFMARLSDRSDVLTILNSVIELLSFNKRISVTVKGLEGDIAAKLRATAGTPCLFAQRMLTENDQIVFVESTHWRHDCVELV